MNIKYIWTIKQTADGTKIIFDFPEESRKDFIELMEKTLSKKNEGESGFHIVLELGNFKNYFMKRVSLSDIQVDFNSKNES